jgi:HPt (histidine-containing phosphotransfer) domain-containing protein
LSHGNLNDLAGFAHKLKGAAGNVSALRLNRSAENLEKAIKENKTDDLTQMVAEIKKDFREFANYFEEEKI